MAGGREDAGGSLGASWQRKGQASVPNCRKGSWSTVFRCNLFGVAVGITGRREVVEGSVGKVTRLGPGRLYIFCGIEFGSYSRGQ